LISKNLRRQESLENSADVNLDILQQNLTKSELTPRKEAILSTVVATSSSSPLSLQSIFSNPPSATVTLAVILMLPTVPFILVNMAN